MPDFEKLFKELNAAVDDHFREHHAEDGFSLADRKLRQAQINIEKKAGLWPVEVKQVKVI